MHDSIVISGCGWVTPFCCGSIDEVLRAAAQSDVPRNRVSKTVPDARLTAARSFPKEIQRDRTTLLTAVALDLARQNAAWAWDAVPAERVGMTAGFATAGQSAMIDFANDVRSQGTRFVSPIRFPQTVGNYASGAMARAFNLRGPNLTFAAWDASSLLAVLEAALLLAEGRADVILAGGTEAASAEAGAGIFEPNVIQTEGSCWFVVEREASVISRGMKPLAAIVAPGSELNAASNSDVIVSMASKLRSGAIFIPHWTGRCAGAVGAAATAAAIGAARGRPVPVAGERDADCTASEMIRGLRPTSDGSIPARVYADDAGEAPVSVALLVSTEDRRGVVTGETG